jgi:hypothetical protein
MFLCEGNQERVVFLYQCLLTGNIPHYKYGLSLADIGDLEDLSEELRKHDLAELKGHNQDERDQFVFVFECIRGMIHRMADVHVNTPK